MFAYVSKPQEASRVYFDHNATTPLATAVGEKVPEWLALWGNPSSIHQSGRGPKALLRSARQSIANLINAHPLEIVFTSGGSEANNLALKGVVESLPRLSAVRGDCGPRRQIVVSAVEHPSVAAAARALVERGYRVDVVPVDRGGRVDVAAYERLLSPGTALVSVMYANNETGSVFPIAELAARARAVGALFHCDAVQALGKVDVDVKAWDVDLASFSGHKFYSLKGCGWLYVKKGVALDSLVHGGGQERGRRAGTENLLAIAAMGEMAGFKAEIAPRAKEMTRLRDRLEAEMLRRIPAVRITGALAERLPNTSSVVIDGVDGESLLMNLDLKGFSVSTGAACSSGSPEPSPVLLAMGLTRAEAQSSLRISVGWGTRESEIELFLEALEDVVKRLRALRHGEVTLYGK